MDYAAILEAANSLSPGDRIRLVETIWQRIEREQGGFELTEELKQELDRRIAEDDADPDGGLPWEQVKAQILADLHNGEQK